MGLLDYQSDDKQKEPSTRSLTGEATKLLKTHKKRKKTRRGKGSKKKSQKQQEHEKAMTLYREQKKQRAEDFKAFERLINTDD